jgi:hypothetical protein
VKYDEFDFSGSIEKFCRKISRIPEYSGLMMAEELAKTRIGY